MRSHFSLNTPSIELNAGNAPSARTMRSHFLMSSAAMACALSAATALMPGICSAQMTAADYATDATYSGGWAAGQNGGYGFGAWSFNGTDANPPGQYQGMSSSAPIGTSWTLLTHSSSSGLANAGRGITGGLLPGETFETVIENPSAYTVGQYHGGYRGWDILFTGGPDNNNPGVNTAALRLQVFDYFNPAQNWTARTPLTLISPSMVPRPLRRVSGSTLR